MPNFTIHQYELLELYYSIVYGYDIENFYMVSCPCPDTPTLRRLFIELKYHLPVEFHNLLTICKSSVMGRKYIDYTYVQDRDTSFKEQYHSILEIMSLWLYDV